jgi:hypothetical protein
MGQVTPEVLHARGLAPRPQHSACSTVGCYDDGCQSIRPIKQHVRGRAGDRTFPLRLRRRYRWVVFEAAQCVQQQPRLQLSSLGESKLDRSITANDLVDANGACPGYVALASPPPAASGPDAGAAPPDQGSAFGGAIALGMSECEVVSRLGRPESERLAQLGFDFHRRSTTGPLSFRGRAAVGNGPRRAAAVAAAGEQEARKEKTGRDRRAAENRRQVVTGARF